MKAMEWRFIDKSEWPERGPWDDELDKKQWLDKATGLPCLIVRSPGSGGLCGYVGVARDHPFYGKNYDDVDVEAVEAHGGLTFADRCVPEDKENSICHIVEPGEDDDVWWFGFDHAHSGDVSPKYDRLFGLKNACFDEYRRQHDSYKTLAYVEGQVTNLAKQLAVLK